MPKSPSRRHISAIPKKINCPKRREAKKPQETQIKAQRSALAQKGLEKFGFVSQNCPEAEVAITNFAGAMSASAKIIASSRHPNAAKVYLAQLLEICKPQFTTINCALIQRGKPEISESELEAILVKTADNFRARGTTKKQVLSEWEQRRGNYANALNKALGQE